MLLAAMGEPNEIDEALKRLCGCWQGLVEIDRPCVVNDMRYGFLQVFEVLGWKSETRRCEVSGQKSDARVGKLYRQPSAQVSSYLQPFGI
jgi:hypothetical protein